MKRRKKKTQKWYHRAYTTEWIYTGGKVGTSPFRRRLRPPATDNLIMQALWTRIPPKNGDAIISNTSQRYIAVKECSVWCFCLLRLPATIAVRSHKFLHEILALQTIRYTKKHWAVIKCHRHLSQAYNFGTENSACTLKCQDEEMLPWHVVVELPSPMNRNFLWRGRTQCSNGKVYLL